MPAVYKLKYQDGRIEDHCAGEDYHYVLGPNTLLHFTPIPAWCRHCKRITIAENLKLPEDIREELRQIEDPESAWYHGPEYRRGEKFVSHCKELLKNQLMLWNHRMSPPRCVICGTTEISFFEHRKWAPHPGTGEEVFFSLEGIANMISNHPTTRYFDPDGRKLAITDAEREHYRTLRRGNKVLRC